MTKLLIIAGQIGIVLSVALFLLLLLDWSQGMVQPHGIRK